MMRSIAVAACFLCFSLPTFAESSFPFEGKWIGPTGACSNPVVISKTEWRVKMDARTGEPDTIGRVKSLKEFNGGYDLTLSFFDNSGDGGSNYNPTYKLSDIAAGKMTVKPGKDPAYVMTRCEGVAESKPASVKSKLLPIGAGFPGQKPLTVYDIYPGMTIQEAEPIMRKAAGAAANTGFFVRTTAYMLPGPPEPWFASNGYTGDVRIGQTNEIDVFLAKSFAGGEILSVWRKFETATDFPDAKPIFDGLVEKYGQPTLSYNRETMFQPGLHSSFFWIYKDGQLAREAQGCDYVPNFSVVYRVVRAASNAVDAQALDTSRALYNEVYQQAQARPQCGVTIKMAMQAAPVQGRTRSFYVWMVDWARVNKVLELERANQARLGQERQKALEAAPRAPTPKL